MYYVLHNFRHTDVDLRLWFFHQDRLIDYNVMISYEDFAQQNTSMGIGSSLYYTLTRF